MAEQLRYRSLCLPVFAEAMWSVDDPVDTSSLQQEEFQLELQLIAGLLEKRGCLLMGDR